MCLALWQEPPLPFVSDRAYFGPVVVRHARTGLPGYGDVRRPFFRFLL